jgi:hypothetical protein
MVCRVDSAGNDGPWTANAEMSLRRRILGSRLHGWTDQRDREPFGVQSAFGGRPEPQRGPLVRPRHWKVHQAEIAVGVGCRSYTIRAVVCSLARAALLLELDSTPCLVDCAGLRRCELRSVPQHRVHNHREASSQSDPGLAHPWYLLRLSPLCLNGYFVANKHEKNQKLVLSFQALSGKFRDQTSAI